MVDDEQDDVANLRKWISQLGALMSSLGGIKEAAPIEVCEKACEAWQASFTADPPPLASAAMLVVLETLRELMQVTLDVTVDECETPDERDMLTRDAVLKTLQEALHGVRRLGEDSLANGLPSAEEIKRRNNAALTSMQTMKETADRLQAEDAAADAEAAADPYGAILGYQDPDVDAVIIFTKLCSFTEAENQRYLDAYNRIRRMIDSELLQHTSDESDRFFDVLIGVLSDLRDNRITLTDEDSIDERRRRLRSALISFTSALHSHKDQTIRAVRETFGRRTPEEQAVLEAFNDLLSSSFEYRWLVEMRDALLHGDINAFKYDFTARLHGEPAGNVHMDRNYMLQFTREPRNKPWLNRAELEQMASDPSVLDMIKAIQPLMGQLQDTLDSILYPNVADDAATVKELIGRFEGRRGLYALQTGPGFTRRVRVAPYMRLAPRVLDFADNYQDGDQE